MIIASAQLDSSVLPTAARQVTAENALLAMFLEFTDDATLNP